MSQLPNIDKINSLVPVVEGTAPLAKSKAIVSEAFGKVYQFLYLPNYTVAGLFAKRELLFQYNVTFSKDFFFTGLKQLQAYYTSIIRGGCLCIKWRIGEIVSRYRILDSRGNDSDWSYFPLYTNQLVQSNFCLEFWSDSLSSVNGIIQPIYLKTSIFSNATAVGQQSMAQDINNPPLLRADLGVVLPETLPYNQNNVVWVNN